jgi:hypothetical protein
MIIPKLLENEIQLFINKHGGFLYIALIDENVACIDILSDEEYINQSYIIKDEEVEINTNEEHAIFIDPKFRDNLLSNDIIIRDMTIDVIINENKDFINQYLKNKI